MPAGVSWKRYIYFFVSSMLSMMAGAQVVHIYYRPLQDFDTLVEQELERLRKEKERQKGPSY